MKSRIENEAEMYRRMAKLIEDARALKAFVHETGLSMPEALARMFSEVDPGRPAEEPRVTIPAPIKPHAPGGVGDDWIYVPIAEAMPTTLVLAALNGSPDPVPVKRLCELVARMRQDVNDGSIANIGTRLDKAGVIDRSDGGWKLRDTRKGPIANSEFVWADVLTFAKEDRAAFRRFAITHVLRTWPDGLQIVQITNALRENCPWFPKDIPVTKDLVKVDVQLLDQAGQAKLVGHSRKWRAVTP